ncbi:MULTISPECIES: tripartite tricarboxylate transporter substrate binding protein [unclassified Bordetella]|uniref:Bug family tripartite tricarboxylate transporter substrate binding protein n=1 Tax=unclassified Bordetella TaxID=2630031 RepID=UPI001323C182|nr:MULTISPECIES: tripartite tricarboxylate transporter substrate binding protein [unclassified Bordetella]MVW70912.1 tripartite tricarboxylate transporter substrate binding protein [Bordetella sp. 15P40C-2]MVW79491.1 tripartite tricarboxylate transporter substrate binding protein [Bordetella sp. 02P26C-1]
MKPFLAGLLLASAISPAFATEFPQRPVKITVPVAPAGILDQVSRIIAPTLAENLGQTVIVENRPGASGNIAATHVARSKPDGYSLLAGYSMFHVGNPVMYPKLDWDPIKDFKPVAMLVVSPHIVTVNPKQPFQTLQDVVDYAKKNPKTLNHATSGNGSVPHIGVELFKQRTGVDIVHVPYKGAGPAVQDVIAGNVEITVATPPSVVGFIRSGQLRPLAVASEKRLPFLPDVPTTAQAGFPDFVLDAWVALFAPADTPDDVVAKLTEAVKKTLATERVQQSLDGVGVQVRYMTPTQLDEQVRKDIAYWQPVIREAGISIE